MDSSSRGFNVLDRKTSLNSDFVRWMKSTDTGSKISIMAAHHHQTNPFSLGDGDSGAQTAGGANDAGGFDCCTTPPGPGGGMAAGFPFTAAQWKELERQAMIYKCMISSVPVPPHLLFPRYGGRYSRKGDPEPGRCKRTDGKKWRCSREVAPQQKYCERHLHRGRPRSRKPVEANNHKKTRLHQTKNPPAPPNHLLKSIPTTNISTPYYNATNSLFKAGEIASSKQPWENLMVGFGQDYPLNLFSYPETDLPTGFSGSDGATVEFESDLSPSLDLAMGVAVGNVSDQQMRNIHCECDDDFDPTNWLSPFGRGGPLGEALQPGSVAGSSPASPYSTPAATVSSPSGVLQRTLFSHSDGSVCNSPTVAAEISNNWHI